MCSYKNSQFGAWTVDNAIHKRNDNEGINNLGLGPWTMLYIHFPDYIATYMRSQLGDRTMDNVLHNGNDEE